jgi:hypothetical protein
LRTLRLLLAGAAVAAAVAVPGTASAQMCRIVIDPRRVYVPTTGIWVDVPMVYCVRP